MKHTTMCAESAFKDCATLPIGLKYTVFITEGNSWYYHG